jgi:predicted ATPase/DNA-binding CsgD family transcriptional regulator
MVAAIRFDSFVGRDAELAELRDLLDRHRLVSIIGPGGVGKTRLALQLTDSLVDLSLVTNGVLPAVAATLGVRPDADAVLAALRGSAAVLLLDNCEQVVDDVAALATELLAADPQLRLLVTTQVPLDVPGEVTYPLGGLPAAGLDSPAARLFADRARERDVGFEPDPAVLEICARLDGVPLYLELASRWVSAMSTAEIAAELSEGRFGLLELPHRRLAPRHRALRAMLEHSHRLLDEDERVAFRRLAVLPGGFGVELAAALCGDGASPGEALRMVSRLLAKSFIHRVRDGRFRMIESIRLFGLERLDEAGEAAAARRRAVTGLAGLCTQIWDTVFHSRALRTQLDAERENLTAAVDWARADPRLVLLATGLVTAWSYIGWYDRSTALLQDLKAEDPDQRSMIAFLLAVLELDAFDHDAAAAHCREALALLRPGQLVRRIKAIITLANATYPKDPDRALSLMAAAAELASTIGNPLDEAGCMLSHAVMLIKAGAYPQARDLLESILPLARANPSHVRLYHGVVENLGDLRLRLGDVDGAEAAYREIIGGSAADRQSIRYAVAALAVIAGRRGRHLRALRLAAAGGAVPGRPIDPAMAALRAQAVAAARAATEPAAASEAEREGAALTTAQTVALALEPEPPPVELSERELEIAGLWADGLTRGEVAARLFVSPRTVDAHLDRVRTKLGLARRRQIVEALARRAAG